MLFPAKPRRTDNLSSHVVFRCIGRRVEIPRRHESQFEVDCSITYRNSSAMPMVMASPVARPLGNGSACHVKCVMFAAPFSPKRSRCTISLDLVQYKAARSATSQLKADKVDQPLDAGCGWLAIKAQAELHRPTFV